MLSFEFDKDSLKEAYEAVISFINDLAPVLIPLFTIAMVTLFWKLGLIEVLISSGIAFLSEIGLAIYNIIVNVLSKA